MAQMPSIEIVNLNTPPCMDCGKGGTVQVTAGALALWRSGTLLQNAFPEMPADLREQVKSGTHPDCWYKMMGQDV